MAATLAIERLLRSTDGFAEKRGTATGRNAGTQLLLALRYDVTNAMYCDNSKGLS